MRHRVDLPEHLGVSFALREAEAAGIRRGRYDARDLYRPFRGVRSLADPTEFEAYMDCYLPRLKPGQRYGGPTAARGFGMPMSTFWTPK